MTIKEIKIEAKERFAVNRYQAMLAYCIVFFIVLNIAVVTAALCVLTSSLRLPIAIILWWYGFILILIVLLLTAPFSYSMTNFFMKSYKGKKMDVSLAFDGFNKYNLERVIVTFLLRFILTLLLTCLLIVPGIIFSIKTSMAFYLLRANPKMKPVSALKASSKIMKGHSGLYFKMLLSFVGWLFFCLFTLGAGIIYILPYFNTCKVVFYKRELQGDKTVYSIPTISMERTEDMEPVRASVPLAEPITEDEEDENNVALRLMKVQLEGEIKSVDTKIEETKKAKTDTQPRADADADFDTIGSSGDNEVQSDDLDAQIATISKLIEEGGAADETVAGENVPATTGKSIIDGMTEDGDGDVEISESGVSDQRTAAKEAIKQRIEQLKKERDMRTGRPTRPVRPQPKPAAAQPKAKATENNAQKPLTEKKGTPVTVTPFVVSNPNVAVDEFAPEKIDVEIIEE